MNRSSPTGSVGASGAVHQLLSVFDPDDAQGHLALYLRSIFSGWGRRSEIYAGSADVGGEFRIRPAADLIADDPPGGILIYHASINSPVGEIFRRSRCRQVLLYHNITPARYFIGYDLFTYLECLQGRRGLSAFIPTCDLALADSNFNVAELTALGFPRVEHLPFPLDKARLAGPALSPAVPGGERERSPAVLFVGRLAPNKRQEDILEVFYYFQKRYSPGARLFLVGPGHLPAYREFLAARVAKLRLEGVKITGKVSREELRGYYRSADLFLCLSEHEGFCLPLLESFYYRLPVVAFAAAAVPETLGGAGVLLEEKNPPRVAALIHRILTERALKEKILAGQDRRLQEIGRVDYEARLRQCLFRQSVFRKEDRHRRGYEFRGLKPEVRNESGKK